MRFSLTNIYIYIYRERERERERESQIDVKVFKKQSFQNFVIFIKTLSKTVIFIHSFIRMFDKLNTY